MDRTLLYQHLIQTDSHRLSPSANPKNMIYFKKYYCVLVGSMEVSMLIDAHTHLDQYIKYENGKVLEKDALEQINSNKILSLANSMDIPSYLKNLELAEKSDFIIPSFGIHPWRAEDYSQRFDELEEYIYESKMIGEIGLDFFWAEKSTFDSQVSVFEYFLQKLKYSDKIINLHSKGAESDIINMLNKYKKKRVIIHWYSGPSWELNELIKMGCYFTVGIHVKYSDVIKDIAREIPLDRLLPETDNPSGQEWLSKNIGMPYHIKEVYEELAKIKKISFPELEQRIFENYINI